MKTLQYHNYLWLSALLICFLVFSKCAKIDDISLAGVPESLNVNSIDTFQVELGTFLLDPLPTAATGNLLLGAYKDEFIGTTQMYSYFRLSQPTLESEFEENIRFDSVTMDLKYNGYFYGDTTKMLDLSLHQLNQPLEKRELPIALEDDEYPVFVSSASLFSDQTFDYNANPLAKIRFAPKPTASTDSVTLKLDYSFGKELFDLAVSKDGKMTNADEFQDYLKGFLIKTNANAEAIIGFKDSIDLVLHYSYENQKNGERISQKIKFSLNEKDYQFNAVETDRSGTILNEIGHENKELNSKKTNGRTFIQSSSGIVTRLRFPTIRTSIGDGTTIINRATLSIETDQAVGLSSPIDTLILMNANRYGTPTSLLTNLSGITASAAYYANTNATVTSKGSYVFDITDYINSLIKSSSYNESESLILAPQITDLLTTIETLHVATSDNRPAIKLNVIYTKTQ